MFSLFDDGITDTECKRIIGLPELRQLIRNNPNTDKIDKIRQLRKIGDKYYKTLKSELPNITPNCILSERNLDGENFEKNFRQFSQYLYFDIDGKTNPEEYKSYFIEKYGHLASLVCLSSSFGGISVLFKVKNTITVDNFDTVWINVRNAVLSGETIDPSCQGIGRAMFISHDPDVFCNFENEIEVKISDVTSDKCKKRVKQSKTSSHFNFRLNSPFSILTIKDVLQKLKTRTTVDVSNPIVDFMPREYVEIYIPHIIKDGTKHRIYTRMIHTLIHLNPEIEESYIFSFLYYVNSRFAKPRMEKREFARLFNMVYIGIKSTGITQISKEVKYIHFNPSCGLSKEEKMTISNMLNGFKRKNESIQKIIDARYELEQKGQKITQKRIAKITGLSPKTVRSHYNSNLTDIDELVEMVNNSVTHF
jgi:hypothetical protein